jgi:hypothetical protein
MKAWIESGTIQGNPDPAKFNYDSVIDMRFVNEGLKKLNWQVADKR